MLEGAHESESIIVLIGETLGTLGRDSEHLTLVLEPFQWGEWVMAQWNNYKANTKAQKHLSSWAPSTHISDRFALLSEAPAGKPFEGTLAIKDTFIGALATLVTVGTVYTGS